MLAALVAVILGGMPVLASTQDRPVDRFSRRQFVRSIAAVSAASLAKIPRGRAQECAPPLGDIAIEGETYQMVFTKLKGPHFNATYYGGRHDDKGIPFVVVQSLGNYRYRR